MLQIRTLTWDLNGIECKLRRSDSQFQDLALVLDNKTFYPLIENGKRSFALYSEIEKLNDETNNINVYVGEDGKLHFVDKDGADTVLNFSSLTLDFSTMKLYNTSAAMNASYTAFHTYFVLPKENIESIAFTAENLSTTYENDTFVAAGNVFISSVNSMDLLLQNGCILCYPGYDTGTIKNKTVINRNGSYSFNDFSDCLDYICFGMGFWNWYGNWRFDIKDIEIKMK